LSDIDEFKNHPFRVENDDSIKELSQSIKDNGLIDPIIVRKKDNGRYELISGHRRKLSFGIKW
jgi:ParB family chromosome partitioning protein